MIKSIEVNNFKSFKNKTKIDLERTNYKMLSSTNTSDKLLKGIMFVGANASGKSNSLLSIKFLLDSLFAKQDVNMLSYSCMFSKEPKMEINYVFEIEGEEIEYYVSFHKINKMITERLTLSGRVLLKREGKYAEVEINEKTQHEDIPDNVLFLRDVYFSTKFRGNEILKKWFEFLSNSIYLDLYRRIIIPYRDIDLKVTSYIENGGEKTINDFFDKYNFEQNIEYDKSAVGHIMSVHADEKVIYFKRKGIEEPIPYFYESTGNRNLLNLLPAFFSCIENGGMLLLDEFSSGFHNDLEELLIKYFMQNATNSQMFFVSHSTNLLTNSLLRPDQIYSVDFDNEGSHLKRFSSEKPREAQNLEKMYLSGIFNGVPRYESKS